MAPSNSRRNRSAARASRQGSILLLSAILLVTLTIFTALAVDVGFMCMAQAQARNSADAAALAGAWELVGEDRLRGNLETVYGNAREKAIQYAALNQVARQAPVVQPNLAGHPDGDIVIGRLNDPTNRSESLSFANPTNYNTVSVRVRCTADRGQAVPLFFARVIGLDWFDATADAAASFDDRVIGFRMVDDTFKCSLLPFTVRASDWTNLCAGSGTDQFGYDPATGDVSVGSDGVREMTMFPASVRSGSEGSGNWGTIDIGDLGNSTADLRRQITHGPSAADMAVMGGELRLNSNGVTSVNGDTGISAGMSDALEGIIGQARTIPLYSSLNGQGNGTWFEIVGFAGVRIVDVCLQGNQKYIRIQPAYVTDCTALTGENGTHSYFVGKPIHLVR